MGRVSGVPVNVYSGLGDLAYGGAGSPTGYENVATTPLGVTASGSPSGGFYGGSVVANLFDDNPATLVRISIQDFGNTGFRVDLQTPQRIGRARYTAENSGTTSVLLESSADGVNFTQRAVLAASGAQAVDTGMVDLPSPITARYWRFRLPPNTHGYNPAATGLYLYAVTTVGAGNPTRLSPPSERRVLAYEPDAGVPEWQAPGAALVDVAALAAAVAAAPGATVGVDVAAAGPAQVALLSELNALAAIVGNLRTDRDNLRTTVGTAVTRVNDLISRLEAAGILAP